MANKYSDDSQKIATYLTTLRRPPELNTKKCNLLKKKGVKFKVQDNHLFCRNSKNVPLRQVFDDPVERQNILQQLHNKSGHKKWDDIYQRVVHQYWWDNLHAEVKA